MHDLIRKSLQKGLLGANAHRNTREVIKDLTPEMARMKTNNFHSSWELLHHIVVWQEAILDGIKGKTVNWKEIGQNFNWPTEEQMVENGNFFELVEKFTRGLNKTDNLIETTDLTKILHLWEDISGFEALLGLLQHNSYHVGQIITVRKMLNIWHLKDWVLED